jgi:hypothetical protein
MAGVCEHANGSGVDAEALPETTCPPISRKEIALIEEAETQLTSKLTKVFDPPELAFLKSTENPISAQVGGTTTGGADKQSPRTQAQSELQSHH